MPSRQFGYPCRIVDKVCRVHVPSLVSRHGPLLATPPFPPSGPQRAWFPALAGTMKALRLPTCASAVAYFVHFRRPRDPSCVCVRHCARGAVALLEGRRSPPGPGSWMPATRAVPAHSRGRQWDLSGLQVIHPVSLLRSWTPVEPMCPCLGCHIGAAPTSGTVKASDDKHFGAQSRSFDTCSPTLLVLVATP